MPGQVAAEFAEDQDPGVRRGSKSDQHLGVPHGSPHKITGILTGMLWDAHCSSLRNQVTRVECIECREYLEVIHGEGSVISFCFYSQVLMLVGCMHVSQRSLILRQNLGVPDNMTILALIPSTLENLAAIFPTLTSHHIKSAFCLINA